MGEGADWGSRLVGERPGQAGCSLGTSSGSSLGTGWGADWEEAGRPSQMNRLGASLEQAG